MTPRGDYTRKVQVVCPLQPEVASIGAVYRQSTEGLRFEDAPQADVRGTYANDPSPCSQFISTIQYSFTEMLY